MNAEERRLCRVDDIEDPGSRGFPLVAEAEGHGIFVVRRRESVFAYTNSCPHTGAPLEWMPDRFLDPGGALIQCALHGALFRMEDGFCVRGPCAGKALRRVAVRIAGGDVVLVGP